MSHSRHLTDQNESDTSLNDVKNSADVVTVILRVEVEVDSDLWTDSQMIAEELEARLLSSNDKHAPEAVLILRVETD